MLHCVSVCLSVDDRVAAHESDNLMGVTNLATIFAAVLLVSSHAVSHLLTCLRVCFVSNVFSYAVRCVAVSMQFNTSVF